MKTAIVLGGTQDHIELIQLLKERGFHTVLADYLDNPPAKAYADEFAQKSILDKKEILELAKTHKASLVIATCIDQALETAAYVSERLNIPCHINYNTALALTNKRYMKQLMLENQIPTSNFIVLNDKDELDRTNGLTYPLVIKPVDANSSKGVFKIKSQEEVLKFFDKSKSFSKTNEVIIEEFVEGKELSIDVFIQNGQATVLMITENIKLNHNKQSFTISESYFNESLQKKLEKDIEHIANQISKAYQLTNGPLLIQCIYNENQNKISVIEFSSRIGGGSKHLYIKTITGFDILRAFVDTVVGGNIGTIRSFCKYSLAKIRYLYTQPGVISDFLNFEELKKDETVLENFIYKTKGSKVEEAVKSTDRCAGFFIVSNDKIEFLEKEQHVMNTIKVINNEGLDILLR